MATDEIVYGEAMLTPKGTLYSANFDTMNTAEKYPNAEFVSDRYDVELGVPMNVDLSALKAECDKVAEKAFGGIDGLQMPFANGDEQKWAPKKGHVVMRAKCTKRPGTVDGKKERIIEADFVPGMQGRAQVTPASYIKGRNKGVRLIVKNIQVFTDEEYTPLTGAVSAEDVF